MEAFFLHHLKSVKNVCSMGCFCLNPRFLVEAIDLKSLPFEKGGDDKFTKYLPEVDKKALKKPVYR